MFLPVCITSWCRVSLWLAAPPPPALGFWPIQTLPIEEHTQNAAALGGVLTQKPTRSALHNYATFSVTSYIPCPKGVTANRYGGKYRLYGVFWSALAMWRLPFSGAAIATSLTMAVSTPVESSSALPPYQSPRRHDSKNTTFHIPAFDSTFCCLLQGRSNSFTSW